MTMSTFTLLSVWSHELSVELYAALAWELSFVDADKVFPQHFHEIFNSTLTAQKVVDFPEYSWNIEQSLMFNILSLSTT